MDSTIIILKEGTKLYRSYSNESKKYGNWFSTEVNDTYGYGSNMAEFILKQDVKILDISKKEFYDKFIKDMNNFFSINNEQQHLKPYILFPLGFDDRLFYREFAKDIGLDLSNKLDPYIHVLSNLEFNNRSRCSIEQLDNLFTSYIKIFYSNEYNGAGCLVPFPNVLNNGLQHKEIMLFDKDIVIFNKNMIRDEIKGGYIEEQKMFGAISIDNEHTREITRKFNEFIKNIDPKTVKEVQKNSKLLDHNKKRKNTTRKIANSSNTQIT
jgi:hypothetical protein